jgi:methylthioribose-1-phosphate isomerase
MLNHRIDTVVVGADGIIVNFNSINKVNNFPIVVITMKIKMSVNKVGLVYSADLNLELS